MLDQNVAMMTNFSIIEQFSKAYKEKILKYAKEFTLYKDQYLFKENEDPEYVYFLVEGTITLQKEFWVSESLICRYWDLLRRIQCITPNLKVSNPH